MSWLRSRRFYAGLLAGLALVLFAASCTRSGNREDEARRVVVRTFSGCCPDSTDADRLKALIASLPSDVVLVETFANCCCGEGPGALGPRAVRVPASPITGTGPGGGPRPSRPSLLHPAAIHPGGDPGLAALPLEDPGVPIPSVSFTAPPASAAGGGGSILPYFGTLLPLVGVLLGGDDNGTICPDDSGLPLGPNREHC